MGWWDYAKWVIPAIGAADEGVRALYRAGDNAVQGKNVIAGDKQGTDATESVLGGSMIDNLSGGGDAPGGPGYAPPGGLDTSQANQSREEMTRFIASLKERAAGNGPSAAQDQLRSATDANIRQSMALGQSQRGVGYQAGLRGILQNQAATQQQSALQSSFLRNQEAMQAQNQLGGLLGTMRQQDLGQQGSSMDMERLRQNWEIAKLDEAARKRAADNQLIGGTLNAAGGVATSLASGGSGGGSSSPTTGPTAPDITPPVQMSAGGLIPGNSPQNDVVPAMLSPGEIVLPRTVAQSPDAPDKAAQFVAAIKAHKPQGETKSGGYGDLLAKQKRLRAEMAQIDSQLAGQA